MRFWGHKIVASSCKYLGLAQVMQVIIFDIQNYSQAHLWVITSNKRTYNCKIGWNWHMQGNSQFTLTGPLIRCDNLQVRLWMIFNTIKNDSHHMGMSQICTIAGDYFRPSKPHLGKLCCVMKIFEPWWTGCSWIYSLVNNNNNNLKI